MCHVKCYAYGSNIPVKRYTYLPVGPRLIQLFGTPNIASIVQNHIPSSSKWNDVYDIHRSPSWSEVYAKRWCFKETNVGSHFPYVLMESTHSARIELLIPCGLLYSLSSICPIRFGTHLHLLLVGIIPAGDGGKEAKNMYPYLEIFVDELLGLSNRRLYDSYSCAPFNLKVEILLYVLALGKF